MSNTGYLASHDQYATFGYAHRCECGATWYDSDGGPCHERCVDCGELVSIYDDTHRCDGAKSSYNV